MPSQIDRETKCLDGRVFVLTQLVVEAPRLRKAGQQPLVCCQTVFERRAKKSTQTLLFSTYLTMISLLIVFAASAILRVALLHTFVMLSQPCVVM